MTNCMHEVLPHGDCCLSVPQQQFHIADQTLETKQKHSALNTFWKNIQLYTAINSHQRVVLK